MLQQKRPRRVLRFAASNLPFQSLLCVEIPRFAPGLQAKVHRLQQELEAAESGLPFTPAAADFRALERKIAELEVRTHDRRSSAKQNQRSLLGLPPSSLHGNALRGIPAYSLHSAGRGVCS